MMFNPGQSQSGGLGSALAQGSGVPDDQFARLATQSMQQTGVTPIAMLADLARRITAKKNAMMNQGLQAGAQMARKPATLKDEINQEALALGIGSQPYGYAGGGLVAFKYGGESEEEPLTAEDVESADLTDYMAQAADAFPADSQEIARLGREFGIDLSPRDSAEVRARKIAEIRQQAEIQRAFNPQGQRSRVREGAAAAAAAAARLPAAATTRSLASNSSSTGKGDQTRTRQGTTPPAAAPAVPADIAEYMKAANAGIAGMEGRGKVTPEELQLREALLAAQQAERQQPVEYKEPEGLTTREMLQLASFDPTKGKWMGSLAEKAAGVMSAREAKAEEAKKANREIDAANRKLNTALAQQRLAYSVGDRQAREAADQAVLNARIALREKVIDFGFKSSDTESRRISAEAARTSAGAAVTSAGQRALSDTFRKDKELGDAIQEAETKITNASMLQGPRATEYIKADTATRESMLKEERLRYVLTRAGMFASEAEIRQRMGAGAAPGAGAGAASGAGAGAQVIRFDRSGNPIQ
jgi:hypothetical protein